MSEFWRGCVLRFCSNGVPDIELEERLGKALRKAYEQGKKART